MKLKIFAVYDSKVEAYLTPFTMRSRGEALRGWEALINDEKTQFAKHPMDFSLVEIAEYDDSTGIIEPHQHKINLGTGVDFVKKELDLTKVMKSMPRADEPRAVN